MPDLPETGNASIPLSFHDAGLPYELHEVGRVFFDIRASYADFEVAKAVKEPKRASGAGLAKNLSDMDEEERLSSLALLKEWFEAQADKPAIFLAAAKGSGTHILKLLNSSVDADSNVLRLASRGAVKARRYLPSVNAADTPFAKIIHRPIAVIGHQGKKCLVEHILEPDAVSPIIIESFISAFSQASFDAIRDEILRPRTDVATLRGENFPIVYAPSPDGGDLQLTPVGPISAYNEFRWAALPVKGSGERVSLTNQEISSKLQNVSSAIGGPRYRFMAQFPRTLDQAEAGIFRMMQGGRVPSVKMDDQLQDQLMHYAALHGTVTSEDEFSNRAMRAGQARLGAYLVEQVALHLDEIRECALEIDPDFIIAAGDPVPLLLSGRWKDPADRERVRVALNAPLFRKLLEERGL